MAGWFPGSLVVLSIRCQTLGQKTVFFFFDTTDCGPDQISRKRKLAAHIHAAQMASNVVNLIYLPGSCLLHQYHLICQSGLSYIDSCLSAASGFFGSDENEFRKYFASLAAIANTWRERASSVIHEWERLFGPEQQGRQFPQHVLQGRWGSVDNAEQFYLARGREKIQKCLLKVISRYMKADKSKAPEANEPKPGEEGDDDAGAGVNALADAEIDERRFYRIKLSKWFSTSFRALTSPIFWFILHISHKIRSPLRHFLHFTQKYSTPRNSENILLLLVEKIQCFQSEWVLLALHAPTWIQEALEESQCSSLRESVQEKLKLLACRLLFKTGNAFDVRIIQRLMKHFGISFVYGWEQSNKNNITTKLNITT